MAVRCGSSSTRSLCCNSGFRVEGPGFGYRASWLRVFRVCVFDVLVFRAHGLKVKEGRGYSNSQGASKRRWRLGFRAQIIAYC